MSRPRRNYKGGANGSRAETLCPIAGAKMQYPNNLPQNSGICDPSFAGLSPEESSDLRYLRENLLPEDWVDGPWLRSFVRDSRDIINTVPWKKYVPTEIYRHFVLPFRVNNENIDYERKEFFARLWPRVATLNMTEAVLAVNRYCHEEVRYAATDIRTVGPAGLLRRALGRCGEQSTMLVALLRSIGIPARQCYVSRWSHTESNHAWVEAWTGAGWHYLGACEPEAALDRGWFRNSLRRATLVETRVGAANYSLEPVLARSKTHSIINLTANYTRTVPLQIRASCQGRALAAAQAQISVFNGGEFFPLHQFTTGADGRSEAFALGLGDILLEVEWQGLSYWKILELREDCRDLIVCELGYGGIQRGFFQFRPAPPIATAPQKETAQHEAGELIWRAKMAACQTETFAQRVLESFPETQVLQDELLACFQSAGCGAKELYEAFVQLFPRFGLDLWQLLRVISKKELAFVTVFALEDFLEPVLPYKTDYPTEIWQKYVLAPQVDFEEVCAHRKRIASHFSSRLSAREVFDWIEQHIGTESSHSFFYYRSAQPPLRSFVAQRADQLSRRILQVALLRLFGHAARFCQSLLAVEWLENGQWHCAENHSARLFLANLAKMPADAMISLGRRRDTLAYQTLYCGNLHAAESLHGELGSLENLLARPLPAGSYRLCLGRRAEGGNVEGWVEHFALEGSRHIELPLREWPLLTEQLAEELAEDLRPGWQIYLAHGPQDEPLYHILNDISNSPSCRQVPLLLAEHDGLAHYLRRFSDLPPAHFISRAQAARLEAAVGGMTALPGIILLQGRSVVFSFCGYSRSVVSQIAGAIEHYQKT